MASTSSVTPESLRKRLGQLSNTQDSIQSLSYWIIHHKNHYRQIVDSWFDVFKDTSSSRMKLTLLYLANDVIQNSKRKGTTVFMDAFRNVLEDVASLCRDDSIKKNVLRLFKIWQERSIYEGEFCTKLTTAIGKPQAAPKKPPKPKVDAKFLAEFQPEEVPDVIDELSVFQDEVELKFKQLSNMNLDVTSTDTISQLKDRAGGKQFSQQFEDAADRLEEYVVALEKEVQLRNQLVDLLEKSEIFYDAQMGEARIVANAYKNFGTRVTSLKKRLDDYKKVLPEIDLSPLPSPSSDAPSPGATPPQEMDGVNRDVEDMDVSDSEDGGNIIAAVPVSSKPLSRMSKLSKKASGGRSRSSKTSGRSRSSSGQKISVIASSPTFASASSTMGAKIPSLSPNVPAAQATYQSPFDFPSSTQSEVANQSSTTTAPVYTPSMTPGFTPAVTTTTYNPAGAAQAYTPSYTPSTTAVTAAYDPVASTPYSTQPVPYTPTVAAPYNPSASGAYVPAVSSAVNAYAPSVQLVSSSYSPTVASPAPTYTPAAPAVPQTYTTGSTVAAPYTPTMPTPPPPTYVLPPPPPSPYSPTVPAAEPNYLANTSSGTPTYSPTPPAPAVSLSAPAYPSTAPSVTPAYTPTAPSIAPTYPPPDSSAQVYTPQPNPAFTPSVSSTYNPAVTASYDPSVAAYNQSNTAPYNPATSSTNYNPAPAPPPLASAPPPPAPAPAPAPYNPPSAPYNPSTVYSPPVATTVPAPPTTYTPPPNAPSYNPPYSSSTYEPPAPESTTQQNYSAPYSNTYADARSSNDPYGQAQPNYNFANGEKPPPPNFNFSTPAEEVTRSSTPVRDEHLQMEDPPAIPSLMSSALMEDSQDDYYSPDTDSDMYQNDEPNPPPAANPMQFLTNLISSRIAPTESNPSADFFSNLSNLTRVPLNVQEMRSRVDSPPPPPPPTRKAPTITLPEVKTGGKRVTSTNAFSKSRAQPDSQEGSEAEEEEQDEHLSAEDKRKLKKAREAFGIGQLMLQLADQENESGAEEEMDSSTRGDGDEISREAEDLDAELYSKPGVEEDSTRTGRSTTPGKAEVLQRPSVALPVPHQIAAKFAGRHVGALSPSPPPPPPPPPPKTPPAAAGLMSAVPLAAMLPPPPPPAPEAPPPPPPPPASTPAAPPAGPTPVHPAAPQPGQQPVLPETVPVVQQPAFQGQPIQTLNRGAVQPISPVGQPIKVVRQLSDPSPNSSPAGQPIRSIVHGQTANMHRISVVGQRRSFDSTEEPQPVPVLGQSARRRFPGPPPGPPPPTARQLSGSGIRAPGPPPGPPPVSAKRMLNQESPPVDDEPPKTSSIPPVGQSMPWNQIPSLVSPTNLAPHKKVNPTPEPTMPFPAADIKPLRSILKRSKPSVSKDFSSTEDYSSNSHIPVLGSNAPVQSDDFSSDSPIQVVGSKDPFYLGSPIHTVGKNVSAPFDSFSRNPQVSEYGKREPPRDHYGGDSQIPVFGSKAPASRPPSLMDDIISEDQIPRMEGGGDSSPRFPLRRSFSGGGGGGPRSPRSPGANRFPGRSPSRDEDHRPVIQMDYGHGTQRNQVDYGHQKPLDDDVVMPMQGGMDKDDRVPFRSTFQRDGPEQDDRFDSDRPFESERSFESDRPFERQFQPDIHPRGRGSRGRGPRYGRPFRPRFRGRSQQFNHPRPHFFY